MENPSLNSDSKLTFRNKKYRSLPRQKEAEEGARMRWFCHVDDDNYLNTDQLVKLLQTYNHTQHWYLGKPSLSHPLEIQSRSNEGVAFWFATGGAGFCISQALGIAMMPEAGWGILEYTLSNIPLKGHRRWGGKLNKVGNSIRLPDDCTVGYIINHILKITMSYNNQNVASVPGFSLKEDPTR
ncbi:fringe glycosyltransferase-like [Crassostrea virginica]